MATYWVTLGYQDKAANIIEDEGTRQKMQRVLPKLKELANRESKFEQLSYVTQDLDEAKSIRAQAVSIMRAEHLEYVPSIIRQPECPNCGFLGRFSDEYCFKCGARLIPREYIE